MPRIVGVDIPANKPILYALRYIHGIGEASSLKIVEEVQIEPAKRARDLTDEELSHINSLIEKNFVVEGQLRRQVAQNISRLKDIGCYRGIRHRRGLPVRGQRTRCNARICQGRLDGEKPATARGKMAVR